jgi:hypothetical protein
MPQDGRGRVNTFYQSPSITSNEVFYHDFKGSKRASQVRPLPEYLGETVERNFRNHSESTSRKIVAYKRLFLFDNQAATGQPFSKKTSLNMKNFSQVALGESDSIKNAYELEASRKLLSPKVNFNMTAVIAPKNGPFVQFTGPTSESFEFRSSREYKMLSRGDSVRKDSHALTVDHTRQASLASRRSVDANLNCSVGSIVTPQSLL